MVDRQLSPLHTGRQEDHSSNPIVFAGKSLLSCENRRHYKLSIVDIFTIQYIALVVKELHFVLLETCSFSIIFVY